MLRYTTSEHSASVTLLHKEPIHTLNAFKLQISEVAGFEGCRFHDTVLHSVTYLKRKENGERSEQKNAQITLPHGDHNTSRPLRSINLSTASIGLQVKKSWSELGNTTEPYSVRSEAPKMRFTPKSAHGGRKRRESKHRIAVDDDGQDTICDSGTYRPETTLRCESATTRSWYPSSKTESSSGAGSETVYCIRTAVDRICRYLSPRMYGRPSVLIINLL